MADKRKKGSVTLQDVAKRADTSLATASRVMSGSDYPVRPELKKRILRAAEELNYTTMLSNKLLQHNAFHTIGVIVPTLQNPFFNQVILGIESAARKLNYEIMIFSSHRSIEQERSNITALLADHVMGLIIISIDNSPEALENYMDCGGKVALLEADYHLDGVIRSETNYYSAGITATDYLVKMGHKKIAFLGAPVTKEYRYQILEGIRKAMQNHGLSFTDRDVFISQDENESDTGMYEFENGCNLAKEFLRSKKLYTAIIAVNDITAFGVIQALNENGVRIPEDVSVMAFDNILYSGMISPALTTIELPSSSMGFAACRMLISMLVTNDYSAPDTVIRFSDKLVVRNSVKSLV